MKRVMPFLALVLMFGTASVALSQDNGTDKPVILKVNCTEAVASAFRGITREAMYGTTYPG